MNQKTTTQTSSSPIASTGRALLSRLASPLRSRTRNLADFHIRPFEPYRKYAPGDVVKGLVVLTVVKPIRITHLTVALHGFARVFKTPNAGGKAPPLDLTLTSPSNSNRRRSQYLGNGYVSLFQDEVVLSGEGRLDPSVYEFEFELDFPKKHVPTSIDFERGSVSYLIRATLTRPTSIAATATCDRNVALIETVDIGPMIPPKAHVISLEPLSRRVKKSSKSDSSKKEHKIDKEALDFKKVPDDLRPTSSPSPEESASQRLSLDHDVVPQSPNTCDIQSETSVESAASSSPGMTLRHHNVSPPVSTRDGPGGLTHSSFANKTITATIELLKAGCLPGDTIPLRVAIQHTKFIKSMHGIIITLYRQGRIDAAPPLSLFTDVKGKAAEKLKHEEYYPKSKTGFGGLSLSSAGSSHVFRKDLSQVFAPIIIDPNSLSTVVTASIRIPEDVFPTITGVPGQMISFRYHIEVVLDLGGKLAAQDKHLPRSGMMNSSPHFEPHGFSSSGRQGGGNGGMVAAWGGSIVDTENIRREKSVIACLFEIIVGTTDSARHRKKENTANGVQSKLPLQDASQSFLEAHDKSREQHAQQDDIMGKNLTGPCYPYHGTAQYSTDTNRTNGGSYNYEYLDTNQEAMEQYGHQIQVVAPVPVPVPKVPAEEELTEKDRIRRAEERLLPSQPPQDDGPSCSQALTASAPEYVDEELYSPESGPAHALPITTGAVIATGSDTPITSAATTVPLAQNVGGLPSQAIHSTTEDKQELERRRLMAEASSPSDYPDDQEDAGVGAGGSGTPFEPSAPILAEEEEYRWSYPGIGRTSERLPRYER